MYLAIWRRLNSTSGNLFKALRRPHLWGPKQAAKSTAFPAGNPAGKERKSEVLGPIIFFYDCGTCYLAPYAKPL